MGATSLSRSTSPQVRFKWFFFSTLGQDALLLPHRIWKVKFIGESVDDCGGGYSESIAEMCDELQVILKILKITQVP